MPNCIVSLHVLTLTQELVSTQYSKDTGSGSHQFLGSYPRDPLYFLADYRPSQGDITRSILVYDNRLLRRHISVLLVVVHDKISGIWCDR